MYSFQQCSNNEWLCLSTLFFFVAVCHTYSQVSISSSFFFIKICEHRNSSAMIYGLRRDNLLKLILKKSDEWRATSKSALKSSMGDRRDIYTPYISHGFANISSILCNICPQPSVRVCYAHSTLWKWSDSTEILNISLIIQTLNTFFVILI